MKKASLFVQITKVDATKREITGIMTEQVTDKTKEKMHYATSKAYFVNWSEAIAKATKGKSYGNVRLMHQPQIAGKVIRMVFDDDAKQIEITTTPANDEVWKMIDEGFITGYSIGGNYVGKMWADPDEPGVNFYTVDPVEVSYVDNPCLRTATFTSIKMQGGKEVTEVRKFKNVIDAPTEPYVPTAEDVAKKAEELAKAEPGSNWGDFMEAAQAALIAEHTAKAAGGADAAAGADDGDSDNEEESGQEKAAAAAADAENTDGNNKPSEKAADPENIDWGINQVFQVEADGSVHKSKADAKAHVLASKTILSGSSPLAAALLEAISKAQEAGKTAEAVQIVFADPGYQADALKRFPLHSDLYIRAAWGILSEAEQAAKYTEDQLAEVRGNVAKAWAEQIGEGMPSVEQMIAFADVSKTVTAIADGAPAGIVTKGLWTVAETARTVDNFRYIVQSVGWEETYEGDRGSVLPSQGRAILSALGTFLVAMATEEVAEMLSEIGVEMTPVPMHTGDGSVTIIENATRALDVIKADTALLEKAGARNSKADKAKLQGIHDHAVAMGAECAAGKAAGDDLQKVAAERDELNKAVAAALPEIERLSEAVTKLTGELEAQKAIVHKLGEEPEPMPEIKPGSAPVEKGAIDPASIGTTTPEALMRTLLAVMPKEQVLEMVTKAALNNPIPANQLRGA